MGAVPKFQIGDAVIFTNDYGVTYPGKTIAGIEDRTEKDFLRGMRYFIEPTDAPWFPVLESNLKRSY